MKKQKVGASHVWFPLDFDHVKVVMGFLLRVGP
jgi:hypothetical protein